MRPYNFSVILPALVTCQLHKNLEARRELWPKVGDDMIRRRKRAVDASGTPRRFLLTGSANLLLMRRVSESLTGRASYLTLGPMTRREQRGLGKCGSWEDLLRVADTDWPAAIAEEPDAPEDWRPLARRGGFPVAALVRKTDAARGRWFDGYVRTYLERDLQTQARITALPDFRRVMRAASPRLGGLVNQAELGVIRRFPSRPWGGT